jgi:hypothetical protein
MARLNFTPFGPGTLVVMGATGWRCRRSAGTWRTRKTQESRQNHGWQNDEDSGRSGFMILPPMILPIPLLVCSSRRTALRCDALSWTLQRPSLFSSHRGAIPREKRPNPLPIGLDFRPQSATMMGGRNARSSWRPLNLHLGLPTIDIVAPPEV